MVFGRSDEGILFSPTSTEPVRLIFLLITPADRPNLQVFFLAQLANVAKSEFVRGSGKRSLSKSCSASSTPPTRPSRVRFGSAFPIEPQDVAGTQADQQPLAQRVADHAHDLLVQYR